MAIPIERLPQCGTVKRSSITPDEYGEIGATESTLYEDVPCRLTRNKHFNDDAQSEAGYVSKSTHLLFMNLFYASYLNITVKVGDKITIDSGETFIVQFPDRAPGGKTGHHQQIYLDHQLTDVVQ